MLDVIDRKGQRPAMNFEVDALEVTGPEGKPKTSYTLSAQALAGGDKRLVWNRIRADNGKLHQFLRHWIYEDHSLWDLAKRACWWGLGVLLAGLPAAIPLERKRSLLLRQGRRERGPEMVTREKFNRERKEEGIGFVTNEEQSLRERLFVRYRYAPMVMIPKRDVSNHFLLLGDSGTGKSALIRQMLTQIRDSGETAIVYDPALEYTPQFYAPERGDIILNPLDERTPYWSLGDEVRHHAEAMTLAASLFPERGEENRFFVDSPRKIFAHLLTHRPTPQELTRWMCQPEEIDKRVAGTELASLIDARAPAQRSGVIGSLSLVADAFRLLPEEKQGRMKWSAAEWSKERKGWLFLTSRPEMRERLRPLISLWLDLLVLRLMNQAGDRQGSPVWFVLDELASLQKLPQLHTALTENRKSNNPVVLGLQGRSQLEVRYGHEAEAMLSQPATKIFLKTSEPRATKWISDTIGEVKIKILRESRTTGLNNKASKSYALETKVEPLIMASEIADLAKLTGYLKSGNHVVPMSFPYIELPKRQPGFIERELAGLYAPLPVAQAAAAGDVGGPARRLTPKPVRQEQKQHFFE
ncbi:MAG: type IV secretion system DNA-binding domain-containing protein [Acidobacteriota bacterium]|nr:type IV secretion system DNA-binding domain-containing protein [Acidobacteriota bacterium]